MLMATDGLLVEGVWHFALRTPLDLDTEPETGGLRLTPYESVITQPLLPVDVPIVPLVPQAEGADCDPLAVRNVCDRDLTCPADTLRCTRP